MLGTVMPDVADRVFVHPRGICESRHVGQGTRIWAFAHVLDGAVIGRECNIGDHAFIEGGVKIGDRVVVKNQAMIWEGVTIEDDVFIGPGVVFTNDRYPRSRGLAEVAARYACQDEWLTRTTVRRGAAIGAGAVISSNVTIGRYASVGAAAMVTRDVPDHRIVVGHPARIVGWVCVCGVPLSARLACPRCERRFETREDALIPAEG